MISITNAVLYSAGRAIAFNIVLPVYYVLIKLAGF